MQNDSGVQSLLTVPFFYKMSQELVGAHQWRKKFIRETVRPVVDDKLVDIGCGPAQMLDWLPAVRYIGFDVSVSYIESAKRRHGARGQFLVGSTRTLRGHELLCDADIVMCCGVLHHLNDDEALDVVRFAHEALKSPEKMGGGGRFVALETAWLPGQSWLSKWMVAQDRGKNVRTEDEYRALAGTYFSEIKIKPDLHPLRIPYAGLVMECIK
jgi:SAM-dependent methyltransferase